MSDIDQACRSAYDLMQAGRAADAVALMTPVVEASPDSANARRMLGLALAAAGDAAAGEAQLRKVLAANDGAAQVWSELAELLLTQGKSADAATAMHHAVTRSARMAPAAEAMARRLMDANRVDDALTITTALGEAGVALHSEALLRAELYEEAVAAAQTVFTCTTATMQTYATLGKAQQGLGGFDEAEASYRAGLALQPLSAPLHRELAQLLWMRSGDAALATAPLDEAIACSPNDANLRIVKAKLLEFAGDRRAALATLTSVLDTAQVAPHLALAASQIAQGVDAHASLEYAEQALRIAPDDALILLTAAEANLGVGRAEDAAQLAGRVRAREPQNQHAIALLATAWRLLDDERYRALYDYNAFVKAWRLDVPTGWSTLQAWLSDFESALSAMHELKAHPIGQSLRGGTQANQSLERSTHPAVRGFFEAIDGPIRRHIESLGAGDDVLRSRANGSYRLAGSWSVRLRPGGAHVSHVHPAGWLSSACYVALPAAIEQGKEGWLAFGEPGIPTEPARAAEHWVKPERGMLVLFPSYMWHGTVPFSGAASRLTCAFDVVPA